MSNCSDSFNDCSNPNLISCNNPCRVSVANTAACESLPSQIENFTTQFFGTVQKSEINGVVVWTLPCDLNIGLPANPRAADEGLACYFLRLFEQGIIGLKGDKGDPGLNGSPGANSYSVTLASFTQPTLGNPNVNILTAYNPAIIQNEYAFIQSSGWYLINGTDNAGTLFLTLIAEVPGAAGTITAGKLVVPCGPPGVSIVGPQGPQGPVGATGGPGASYTATNGFFKDTGGSDYTITNVDAVVDFTDLQAAVLLTAAGTYQITVVTNWKHTAGALNAADQIFFKLVDQTAAADVPGSVQSRIDTTTSPNGQCVINVHYTVTVATQVGLYVRTTSAATLKVPYDTTTITFIRIA